MSLPSEVLRALVKAGCTAEQIVVAVEAAERAEAERDCARRESDRNRKRAQREREKQAISTPASEMSRGQDVTACDGADSDDQEKKAPDPKKENPPLQKKNPPTGVKKKGSPPTHLPADWRASPDERAYAAALGFSAPEVDRIEVDYRDYWHAKPKDATKRDWTATWQRWCRQEADRKGKRPMPAGEPEAAAPSTVFVEVGTDEWRAWKEHKGGRVTITDERRDDGTVRRGWYFPARWPPAAPLRRAVG